MELGDDNEKCTSKFSFVLFSFVLLMNSSDCGIEMIEVVLQAGILVFSFLVKG